MPVIPFSTYLCVALGGALGSVLRFLCVEWIQLRWANFPWGTLCVNVVGSLVIGGIAALSAGDSRVPVPAELRQFLMVGMLGGFTTFSSFSLQTVTLLRSGAVFSGIANVVASVVLCLLAAWLGWVLASPWVR